MQAIRKPLSFGRIRASLEYRVASRSFRMFEGGKRVLHSVVRSHPEATLFIFGCQRSGTTHLERLLRADPRSVVFGEFSTLSIDPEKTVWLPLPELRHRLETAGGDYAVARSLLASHRAAETLDAVPGSRAVWMFRRADEVVSSMLRKWKGGFEEISRRVESDAAGKWELAPLWQALHKKVAEISTADPGSEARLRDLYGLYWHARNAAFFDLGLENEPRIRLLDYQTLLTRPSESVRDLTGAIGIGPPQFAFPLKTGRVNPRMPKPDFFSPPVRSLCDTLHARLSAVEQAARP